MKKFYLDFTYAPKRNQSGKIDGVLAAIVDVTDKVIARDENARLYEGERNAVRARDEFLSIASHELKTPLTSMKINAQVMKLMMARKEEISLEKTARFVEVTERQTNRLSRLVDDMLDISRIHTGKLLLDKEQITLSEIIEDVVLRFNETRSEKAPPISLEYTGALSGFWDKFRLEQVISNIVSNAIKYGGNSQVKIHAYSSEESAIIEFIDGGIGVSAEKREKIFERFERGGISTEISGLGLGLFISKQIVEAHGGSIHVEPNEPKGSRFILKLPMALKEEATVNFM
jgi:signal transduction histidine kinase